MGSTKKSHKLSPIKEWPEWMHMLNETLDLIIFYSLLEI